MRPLPVQPIPAGMADAAFHLVHLNDTEGAVADVWPPIATALRMLRRQTRHDLLLHAGDVPLGSPEGEAVVRIMNSLGVDAVALGNHDLDAGIATFAARAGQLRAPVLCANVAGLPPGSVRPYRLVRRRGLRVAIVGITLADLRHTQPMRYTLGLRVQPAREALDDLVPRLRRRADVVVVLSHCGYDADVALAQEVSDIDVIVGGHSHHLVTAPVRVGATAVVQAGAGGGYVGWLMLRREDGLRVSGGVVPTAGLEPDPRTRVLCRAGQSENAMPRIVGHTATDLTSPTYAQETPLGNLTADLMRAYAGTDLTLLRCGTVNNSLPAGPIRHQDLGLLNNCGADQVVRLRLTGAEIIALLEYGALNEYFLLTTSGARVTYDATRPEGQRVVTVDMDAGPLQGDHHYTVACSEVLAHGVGGYPGLRDKPRTLLPRTITDLLAQHIAAHGVIRPGIDGRLTVHGTLQTEALSQPTTAH